MNYFAYGSNMGVRRMEERKVPFSARRAAHLCGYCLKFNKVAKANYREGKANIILDEDGLVEGALYEIEAISLPKLDNKEKYPEHYLKIPVKVRLPDNGQEVCAITYIAHPDKIKEGLKPTKVYLQHMLEGKDILSDSYFNRLKNIETLD
jgi:gamma-glutamylcyclotransferase